MSARYSIEELEMLDRPLLLRLRTHHHKTDNSNAKKSKSRPPAGAHKHATAPAIREYLLTFTSINKTFYLELLEEANAKKQSTSEKNTEINNMVKELVQNSDVSEMITADVELYRQSETQAKILDELFRSFETEKKKTNNKDNRVVDHILKRESDGPFFRDTFIPNFRTNYFNSNSVRDKLFTNDIKNTNVDKTTNYNYLSTLSNIINTEYADKRYNSLEEKLTYFLYDIFKIITNESIVYTKTFEKLINSLNNKIIEIIDIIKNNNDTEIVEINEIYTNIKVILDDIKKIITEFKKFDLHINPLYNDIVSLNETIEEYLKIYNKSVIFKEIIKFDLIKEIKDAFLNQNIILAEGKQSRTRKKKLKKKIKSKKYKKRKKENK
tara:strand:+ start:228 stop:1373 length:1146 start_codon:yes stop_codon:yes gene_type:complete